MRLGRDVWGGLGKEGDGFAVSYLSLYIYLLRISFCMFVYVYILVLSYFL